MRYVITGRASVIHGFDYKADIFSFELTVNALGGSIQGFVC